MPLALLRQDVDKDVVWDLFDEFELIESIKAYRIWTAVHEPSAGTSAIAIDSPGCFLQLGFVVSLLIYTSELYRLGFPVVA
ncbi:MAG: hypothetical protein M1826_005467 [Phylliscum demangeonii]|nr:MAG: hypothetical protein M1826_005467 [Phylliscum demangeonii]